MSQPSGGWPLVEAPKLIDLREALRRRSKAIGYRVGRWSCERQESSEGESLLVVIRNVRFRLWADGTLWVHVELGTCRVSFHGSVGLVPLSELVTAAEESLLSSGEDGLVALWRRFEPYDVESSS